MADVFISKSTLDDKFAFALCRILEENKLSCWIAPRDLKARVSERYADHIVEAIEEARLLILILSHNSNISEHCMNEVTTACDKKKKVFVLQIEKVNLNNTFVYYLSQEQWVIDYEAPNTGNFEKIITEVAAFLGTEAGQDSEKFIDIEYQKRLNFQNLARRTYEKRKAFAMSIYDKDEAEKDYSHIYENIIRLDVVDSEKNTWSSYRLLTVRNDTNNPTSYIVHRECGENKATFKEMRVRAKQNGASGQKLKVESMTPIQPNEMQLFRIYFPAPLKPGELITIFYRMDWPNEPSAYYMKELSQSISLSRYLRGVNNLTFGLFEPYRILSSSLVEVSKMNTEKPSDIKPILLDIKEEQLLSPLHEKTYYGVKYTIKEPKAILYQIRYYKEEIQEEDSEDDFF